MANILLKPKNRKERDAKEALQVISEKTEGTFRKSFDVGFARNSSIHKGKRKKAVPAKPKKRKVRPTFLKKNDGRVVCNLKSAAGARQYMAYLDQMWLRDNGECVICHKYVNFVEATFEHTDLRSGGRQDDRPEYTKPNGQVIRNGVAHLICNGKKGSRRDV